MGFMAVLGEIVPSTSMVMVEGSTIGLTILASTAISKGMSPFVFVVYTNAIGSIILLPYSFLYDRNTSEMPLLTLPFLVRVFFLGLIGVTMAQNLAFLGLSYSSPIVAIGMANIIPAISFLLAIILSMMGAIVCGVGYSTVMWGQAREDGEMHKNSGNPLSSPDDKVPLLQEYSQV
ncbi:WAT1-related At1g70260-like [Olea europaea subsp. europaea]|uniref:WAT1-related protein n=1 Tax=Olea europaea subsp. europaea TaxID=158383 RepID=A0A8S0V987_OLEEU|nr:WAT1-related At1g70260-like [Olea europaea subsp. europaea]